MSMQVQRTKLALSQQDRDRRWGPRDPRPDDTLGGFLPHLNERLNSTTFEGAQGHC